MSKSESKLMSEANQAAVKELNFAILIDTSGSMAHDISQVEQVLKDLVADVSHWSKTNRVPVYMLVITFGDVVDSVVGNALSGDFEDINNVVIPTLVADGPTPMGGAVSTLSTAFNLCLEPKDGKYVKKARPVVLLMSDGIPTDCETLPMAELNATRLGKLAVRTSIAFGPAANKEVLSSFLSPDMTELDVFQADNADQLVKQFRTATFTALNASNAAQPNKAQAMVS